MEASIAWARAEVFSAKIVFLYSLFVFLAAIGFWLLGKTAMARAFVFPILASAIFMFVVSTGLYWANKPRTAKFKDDYSRNPDAFINKEIIRTAKSKKELAIVLKVLPLIIMVAAGLFLIISSNIYRAIALTITGLAFSLLLIDSNTDARNTAYHNFLTKSDGK
jgi:ABC-2 type transport system permease protein